MEKENLTLEQLTDLLLEGKIFNQELDDIIKSGEYLKNQEETEKRTPFPEEEIEKYFTIDVSYNPTDHEQRHPHLTFFFEGIELGYASFEIDHSKKTIFWEEFYPYDQIPGIKGESLAIGTLAHIEALSFISNLSEKYSSYTIAHSDYVTSERRDHLSRIGEDGKMPLNEALLNTKEYAIENGLYSPSHLEKISNWFVPHQK